MPYQLEELVLIYNITALVRKLPFPRAEIKDHGLPSQLRGLPEGTCNTLWFNMFFNVVPFYEETSFHPPSMVFISVIIHYTLHMTILNGPLCAPFHVLLCTPAPWQVGAHCCCTSSLCECLSLMQMSVYGPAARPYYGCVKYSNITANVRDYLSSQCNQQYELYLINHPLPGLELRTSQTTI